MKIWKRYSHHLLSGEWHIHTHYTDGESSVDDYCKRAVELEIPLIAFTEHVRKDLDYDFHAYLEDIERAREQYDVIILLGCEAKVLPDGSLDIDDAILEQVDYPIFAFHFFPGDGDAYLDALYGVLKNPYVNTWAHPGTFFRKIGYNVPVDEVSQIFTLLRENEILFELNRKYAASLDAWIDLARDHRVDFVRGSDCHCVEEME